MAEGGNQTALIESWAIICVSQSAKQSQPQSRPFVLFARMRLFLGLPYLQLSFLPSIQQHLHRPWHWHFTHRNDSPTSSPYFSLHHTRTDRRGTVHTLPAPSYLYCCCSCSTIPTSLWRHRLDAPAGSRDPHTLVYHASRVQSTSPITAIRAAKAPCTTPIVHHHPSPHPTAELARSAPWRPASRRLSAISYTTRGSTAH